MQEISREIERFVWQVADCVLLVSCDLQLQIPDAQDAAAHCCSLNPEEMNKFMPSGAETLQIQLESLFFGNCGVK